MTRKRHGAPERKTQKMPLSTRRSFTRRTVAAERGGIVLLGQLPIGGRHSGKTERLHLLIDSKCRHGCWCVGARL